MLKIHHLNCGSVREVDPTYDGPSTTHAVNHCLLIETESAGLVLVETGLGLDDIRHPDETLGREWVEISQPVLAEEETAIRQVEALGFSAADVQHIVLTHLDIDHCGGLPDFPEARVHVLADELSAALAEARSFRYRPAHWAHAPQWVAYGLPRQADWFGFGSIELAGLPADIRLVPLGGHTAGHAGVAVRDGERWLLHCGDAYYYHLELEAEPEPHPLLDVVQTRSQVHPDLRFGTQARLRELVRRHGDEVSLFSAHDPWELARYASGERDR
jgi:glyoxylase-like metal-dependent hydrolase (beta-lactamase superfamily II)